MTDADFAPGPDPLDHYGLATEGHLAREPVAIWLGTAWALFSAGLGLADAFDWWGLEPNQTTAIWGFASAVMGATGVVLRSRVFAPATVAGLVGRS